MQAPQLQSSWISLGVPSRNCWGSLRCCLSPYPIPPFSECSYPSPVHTIKRQSVELMWHPQGTEAGTVNLAWEQIRSIHSVHSCDAAVGLPSSGWSLLQPFGQWMFAREKKCTWAFKGDWNSTESHCEYKRTEIKGLKKLMDSLPALQWSGCFWLRNSLSCHYKACMSRAKEVDIRLKQRGKYRAALPWCTLTKQWLTDSPSPRFRPFPIIIVC